MEDQEPTANSLKKRSESLFDQFNKRLKQLDDREKDLAKREALLKSATNGAESSDVIYLNVGGRTCIAVLRRTLTTFGKTLLGAQFSGRWDDSLPKDKDGNFFIDQDPDLFLELLSFLRATNNESPHASDPDLPTLTRAMDRMLEYYQLTFAVFAVHVKAYQSGEDFIATKSGRCDFSIKSNAEVATFCVQPVTGNERMIRCFTVTVGKFTELKIGWIAKGFRSFSGDSSENVLLDVARRRVWNGQAFADESELAIQEGTSICFSHQFPETRQWSWAIVGEEAPPIDQASHFSIGVPLYPAFVLKGEIQINEVSYVKLVP